MAKEQQFKLNTLTRRLFKVQCTWNQKTKLCMVMNAVDNADEVYPSAPKLLATSSLLAVRQGDMTVRYLQHSG